MAASYRRSKPFFRQTGKGFFIAFFTLGKIFRTLVRNMQKMLLFVGPAAKFVGKN